MYTFYLNFLLLMVSCFCIENDDPETRIVGGDEARSIESTPYLVSIRLKGKHFCGGSILSKNCIVTAAHCCQENGKYTVKAGTKDQKSNDGQEVEVDEVIVHPKYNKTGHTNDIAIMKLKKQLRFSSRVSRIRLTTTDFKPTEGMCATVSGWGVTDENSDDVPNTYRYVDIPIIDWKKCKQEYEKKKAVIAEGMICAGSGRKDSCSGDSGGPLVYENKLIGVVSWGIGCAEPDNPGVYTDVSHYLDFIKRCSYCINKD